MNVPVIRVLMATVKTILVIMSVFVKVDGRESIVKRVSIRICN